MSFALRREAVRRLHGSRVLAQASAPSLAQRATNIIGSLMRGSPTISQDQALRLQLSIMYKGLDQNQDFHLGMVNQFYERIRAQKGYDSFLRRRVLWFWTKKAEDYIEIANKFKIFDALTARQRVQYYQLNDREIPSIASVSGADERDVYQYIQEAKHLNTIFLTLRRRRQKGLVDIQTRRELAYIQTSPTQCWSKDPYPMKNPWEKRASPKPSKYAY